MVHFLSFNCGAMASSAVCSLLYLRNAAGNHAETCSGAYICYGDAASFHEWEFCARLRIAGKNSDQHAKYTSCFLKTPPAATMMCVWYHELLCRFCTCVRFRRAPESQAKRCLHICHHVGLHRLPTAHTAHSIFMVERECTGTRGARMVRPVVLSGRFRASR